MQFLFDCAISGQRTLQCTIAQYYLMMTSHTFTGLYFISRDLVSSNQMTRIYIGVIHV